MKKMKASRRHEGTSSIVFYKGRCSDLLLLQSISLEQRGGLPNSDGDGDRCEIFRGKLKSKRRQHVSNSWLARARIDKRKKNCEMQ